MVKWDFFLVSFLFLQSWKRSRTYLVDPLQSIIDSWALGVSIPYPLSGCTKFFQVRPGRSNLSPSDRRGIYQFDTHLFLLTALIHYPETYVNCRIFTVQRPAFIQKKNWTLLSTLFDEILEAAQVWYDEIGMLLSGSMGKMKKKYHFF